MTEPGATYRTVRARRPASGQRPRSARRLLRPPAAVDPTTPGTSWGSVSRRVVRCRCSVVRFGQPAAARSHASCCRAERHERGNRRGRAVTPIRFGYRPFSGGPHSREFPALERQIEDACMPLSSAFSGARSGCRRKGAALHAAVLDVPDGRCCDADRSVLAVSAAPPHEEAPRRAAERSSECRSVRPRCQMSGMFGRCLRGAQAVDPASRRRAAWFAAA